MACPSRPPSSPRRRPRPARLARAVTPLAGVVIIGLAVAACGGGASKTSAPTTAAATPTTTVPATTTTVPATTTVPTTGVATTVPAPTTVAPTTVPAGPTTCATAALTLSISGANGAAGSTYENLDLQNSGTTACTLDGFPGVSFVTGSSGTQVGAAATRDPSSTAATVTLAAGATATAQLRLVDPGNFDPTACQATPVLGFRVYPPGQTTAGFVAASGTACASTSIQGLTVGAIQAS